MVVTVLTAVGWLEVVLVVVEGASTVLWSLPSQCISRRLSCPTVSLMVDGSCNRDCGCEYNCDCDRDCVCDCVCVCDCNCNCDCDCGTSLPYSFMRLLLCTSILRSSDSFPVASSLSPSLFPPTVNVSRGWERGRENDLTASLVSIGDRVGSVDVDRDDGDLLGDGLGWRVRTWERREGEGEGEREREGEGKGDGDGEPSECADRSFMEELDCTLSVAV